MRFNPRGDISILKSGFVKLVDKFTYLRSSVSSTEKNINTRPAKTWTANDRVLAICNLDPTDKIKHSFYQAAVVSKLPNWYTTGTLTHCIGKQLIGNYTRMLRALLNKSYRQHTSKQLLYCHLPPITKTIQFRQNRHVGHCWKSKEKLIRNALLRTTAHRPANVSQPTRTYIQKLCADTGYCLEDLAGCDGW